MSDETEREQHTLAHRVSLGVSIAVLAALAIVLLTSVDGHQPARPVAEISAVRVEPDETRHVIVEVANRGGRAAASVQVSASVTIDGEEQTGDQTIDFLGAGEQRTVVFVVDGDPTEGDMVVRVTGFAVP